MALASRLTLTPDAVAHWPILLTAKTAIIHGDPDHQGRSNVKPFRRVAQLVQVSNPGKPVEGYQLHALIDAAPYPRSLDSIVDMTQLSASQYFGIALLVRFLRHYNNKGLLDGMERYTRLADHLSQSAARSDNLLAWWSDLADALQVGGRAADDKALMLLLTMPHALGGHVLRVLQDEAETTIMFARAWHDDEKLMDAGYADKAEKIQNSAAYTSAAYTTMDLPAPAPTIVRTLPHFSSNALRHAVRAAADAHQRDRLGLDAYPIPSIAHLFGNGGGIEKNASAPTDETALGYAAAKAYPVLELLGGATGLFLLPTSMLCTPNWLVCTENRAVLKHYGIDAHHPAESLVTVATHVRGGDDKMPHAAEQLDQGSQILVDYALRLEASPLCRGAFAAALTWWHDHMPILGGVSVQEYGQITFDLPTDAAFTQARDAYEAYLSANKDRLRQGLIDGTLATGKVIAGKGASEPKAAKGKGKATPEASGGLFDAEQD